jgi:hypothetical protein
MSASRNRTIVEVPAQALLAALATPETLRDQLRAFSPALATGSSTTNPFELPLRFGMRLVAVELQKLDDEDGDLLRFSFEGDDPAIGPIKVEPE